MSKQSTDQSGLASQLATRAGSKDEVAVSVKGLLSSAGVKKRFEEVMKQRAPQYMTSILNLYNSDTNLQKCEPMSIVSSAMVAATLDLPVDKNLGYAWVVPYGTRAQFQLGYKGYIQLALRTGQYRYINAIPIYEGELQKWDRLTEEFLMDTDKRTSDKIIGYAGYFELINGFRKRVYWTREQIEAHRIRFSKSDFGWKKDYDAMALKTVIRNMLSKWGILSIEMQTAHLRDLDAKVENAYENEAVEAEFIVYPDEDDEIRRAYEVADGEQGEMPI